MESRDRIGEASRTRATKSEEEIDGQSENKEEVQGESETKGPAFAVAVSRAKSGKAKLIRVITDAAPNDWRALT